MSSVTIVSKRPVVTRSIDRSGYPAIQINETLNGVTINQVLPFRIRFKNIGIPSFSPGQVEPIGIAVIGYNNYIL